jgi:microcompartment protein CcmL/EutN
MTRTLLNYVLVAAFGTAVLATDTAGPALLQALRNGDMGNVKAAIENGIDV